VTADRYDRRRVMFLSQSVMLGGAAVLAAATLSGRVSLALLYAANAVLAAAVAFDSPARQALVPRLVPEAELAGALSMNLTMMHAAMIGGPAVAGFVIAGVGMPVAGLRALAGAGASEDTARLALIYALNALSFVGVLVALVLMRTSGLVAATGPVDPPLQALREGLRFVFRTPIMVWTTALDFVATFFAGSMSLLPIVADQVLHSGPAGYGWLVAAPALGALAGSAYTSVRHLPPRQGRILLGAVAAYGVTTVAYGLSRSYWLTFLALASTGLADVVSTVIRQTLRQLLTPDALRGRMTSVNMIFFMGGPQLGELEAGVVASLFASAAVGATVSIVSGGLATVLLAFVVSGAAPVVREYVQPSAPPRA
jgi:MFS family permease